MTQRIPVEYVEGPNGTTMWLWPNSPESMTVEFDAEEWESIKERVEASDYADLEEAVGTLLLEELPEEPGAFF
jgi:hypothetical protein